MEDYILLAISCILVNNILLMQYLGNCPFLGVSKKMETATGMAMAVNPEAIAELAGGSNEDSEDDPYESYKTGKTKSILGYSCDEYLIAEGSGEIRVWTSEKLGKEVGQEMLNNQQAFGGAFSHAVFTNGMVMEYNFLDKDNGEKMVLKVTKIDMNGSHTISTSEYNVMSLGQMQQF